MVNNTTFLEGLNLSAAPAAVPEWDTLCFAHYQLPAGEPQLQCMLSALQYSFKTGKRTSLSKAADMAMGRTQGKENDKICIQQRYIRISR